MSQSPNVSIQQNKQVSALLWPIVTTSAFLKWLFLKPVSLAQNIMQQPVKAFPVVDFLKGLSVLMVILFHIFFAVFILFKKEPEKLQQFIESIPAWLSFILAFDKAVDIFFMLSTFLLSYALLKVFNKKQRIDIGRFYLHRFFRIYPLFLVALLLYGLADIDKLLTEGWYSLLFIENIYSKGIIPVQWSLSIEMQFYLALPFILIFLARSRHPIIWLLSLIVLSVFTRLFMALQDPVIYQSHWYNLVDTANGKIYMDTMYYLIQTRVTPLFLGMLWAVILWKYPQPKFQLQRNTLIILWLFGLSLIYLSMRFPVYNPNSLYYLHFNEFFNLFMVTFHRIIFSVAILALVLLAFYQVKPEQESTFTRLKNRMVNWKIWRLLSEVAYPMYFFHFPFIVLAWVIVLGTVDPKNVTHIPLFYVIPAFVLAVLFTLYLSLWLNHVVEARFIGIGKQIETKWFGGHNTEHNSQQTICQKTQIKSNRANIANDDESN